MRQLGNINQQAQLGVKPTAGRYLGNINQQPTRQPSFGQKALSTVGDILNIPSYVTGGVIKEQAQNQPQSFWDKINPVKAVKTLFKGGQQGLQNKTPVMQELPKGLGMDPNSAGGMAVGFAGELLTPNIPIAGLAGKGLKMGSKALGFAGKTNKVGGVLNDMGQTLLQKSYKLSSSDIDKIAKSIGVVDPATKTKVVFDYLESQGLRGASKESLGILGKNIENIQEPFNALTRTGTQISRQPFIDALWEEAIRADKLDTPQSRQLVNKLLNEIKLQQGKLDKVLTDTELQNRISQLFKEAGESQIANPVSANLSKRMAIAGTNAREVFAPGSMQMGRQLKGLRTTQEVISKKANTGLGTQLINALKPSGFGFAIGAGSGYASGQNPLATGLAGSAIGIGVNNPKVLNMAGKLFTKKGPNLSKASKLFSNRASQRLMNTGVRLPFQPKSERQSQKTQLKSQLPQTYNPIISPKASEKIIMDVKRPKYNFSFRR